MTTEQESQFLQRKTDSETEIEILAEVDGVVTGLAGIEAVGSRKKIRQSVIRQVIFLEQLIAISLISGFFSDIIQKIRLRQI